MAQVIGIVKLAPGEVGFYDELSKIHLTMSRPKANVYDYMNTAKLVRAVRGKVLMLVAGSLNATRSINEETPVAKEVKAKVAAPDAAEVKMEEKPQAVVLTEVVEPEAEQPLVEEAPAEEIAETVQEEVVEIEQPKKRSTRKKKKEEE